jgi:hypothetical protein
MNDSLADPCTIGMRGADAASMGGRFLEQMASSRACADPGAHRASQFPQPGMAGVMGVHGVPPQRLLNRDRLERAVKQPDAAARAQPEPRCRAQPRRTDYRVSPVYG